MVSVDSTTHLKKNMNVVGAIESYTKNKRMNMANAREPHA